MGPNNFCNGENASFIDSHTTAPKVFDSTNATEKLIAVSRLSVSELQLGKVLGSGSFCKIREITGRRKSPFQSYQSFNQGGSHYVVKQLKNGLEGDDAAIGLDDLRNEAELLEQISHPNIIQIRGAAVEEENDNRFFIMLDLIETTLEQQINNWELKKDNGKSTRWMSLKYRSEMKAVWTEKINAASAISSAMHYLHEKKIIYRDLKPQNIGFDKNKVLKLYDFGLARKLDPKDRAGDNYNMTGLTGSMRYMAPEVFNEKPYNLSADVYSFGILFWYMCSLETPFYQYSIDMMRNNVANGSARPEMCKSWRKGLRELMESCWDSNASQRPEFVDIRNTLDRLNLR